MHDWIRRKFGVREQFSVPYVGTHGTRETLAEFFGEIGFSKGAEIGVYEGEFSEKLCLAIPNLKLICVDGWIRARHRLRKSAKRLSKYDVEFKRMQSMDAIKQVLDDSLDFVYIDASHDFDNIIVDLIEWSRKVRSGGIVSGHDFFNFRLCDVPQAVNVYTLTHGIYPWYVTREDWPPSYFWIKP